MDGNMMTIAIAVLAFVAIAGLGLAFSGGEKEAARKRARAIGAGATVSGRGRAGKVMDESAKRRAKTQEMLDSLRKQGRRAGKAAALRRSRTSSCKRVLMFRSPHSGCSPFF
jgi:tight adherence protein B